MRKRRNKFQNQVLRFPLFLRVSAFCLSVFTLDFRDRLSCASGLLRGVFAGRNAPLKFVRDGRVKVAANRIGNLGNIFAAGLLPLMRPDGHLQNLALAVRIGAAFRKVFCRGLGLRALGSNFLGFFAVRHEIPPIQMRWQGKPPGGVKIES